MVEIRRTVAFRAWLRALRDERGKARIASRIDRLALGNFGDVKPVGEGVSELRIFYGPGYRVYPVRRGNVLVILLCGGDKAPKGRDVEVAKALARDLDKESKDGN